DGPRRPQLPRAARDGPPGVERHHRGGEEDGGAASRRDPGAGRARGRRHRREGPGGDPGRAGPGLPGAPGRDRRDRGRARGARRGRIVGCQDASAADRRVHRPGVRGRRGEREALTWRTRTRSFAAPRRRCSAVRTPRAGPPRAPSLPIENKRQLIADTLRERANPLAVNLLGFLVEQGRAREIGKIIEALAEVVAATRERAVAEVRSAVPLGDARAKRLADALSRATGRPIEVRVIVDPSVLGGVVAKVGDEIFDGSVRSRLIGAREQLTGTTTRSG